MAQLPNAPEHDATVVNHRWNEFGRESKLALQVIYDVNGTQHEGLIWFTEAAQNMGRRALMSLGFDITAKDAAELDDNKTLLAGKKCKVRLVPYSNNGRTEMKADLVIPRDLPVGRGALKALGERIKAPPKPKPKEPVANEWDEPIQAQPSAAQQPRGYDPDDPESIPF